jgi:hypothetical protein
VSVNHKGKERLILDLRHVNQYIQKRKHKFEGVSEAIQHIIKDGLSYIDDTYNNLNKKPKGIVSCLLVFSIVNSRTISHDIQRGGGAR